ncbi:MAG: F0F1 ATP synthase subunit epsilon [Nitrospiraceae bacterium]|nr:MAG: F0F1 ATP synthase subunit epsilon [Nitrospiraceae bacterium]
METTNLATKLKLEIVTPYGTVFSEEVDEVIASGSEGEFGVLPNHIPFLTTLKIGMLIYKKGSETGYFFVNWGYAEVGPDKVLILADSAERSDSIDVQRALEAKKRAEERLKQAEKYDHARATAALDRAIARIQVAEKK